MRITKTAGVVGFLVSGLVAGCVGAPPGAEDDSSVATAEEALSSTSYSGRASVLRAQVTKLTTTIADTGALPSTGGTKDVSVLTVNVPGLLRADALDAYVAGNNDHTIAQTTAANVSLGLSSVNVTVGATVLASQALASCKGDVPSFSGGSVITALTINGQAIVVTGAPNQTVNLLLGKVIINERSTSQSGSGGSIHTAAVHVLVAGLADVSLAAADAGITCASSPPPPPPPPPPPACNPKDYVTGQGYIASTPSNRNGYFSFFAEAPNGVPTGNATYDDDGSSEHVKSTDVTSYTSTGPTSRKIQGHATIRNKAGTFTYTLDVTDNGAGGDLFNIAVSDGYHASGTVASGTIDLFVETCP